jgi:hypothetical protein
VSRAWASGPSLRATRAVAAFRKGRDPAGMVCGLRRRLAREAPRVAGASRRRIGGEGLLACRGRRSGASSHGTRARLTGEQPFLARSRICDRCTPVRRQSCSPA